MNTGPDYITTVIPSLIQNTFDLRCFMNTGPDYITTVIPPLILYHVPLGISRALCLCLVPTCRAPLGDLVLQPLRLARLVELLGLDVLLCVLGVLFLQRRDVTWKGETKLKPIRTNGTPLQLNAFLTGVYHIDITAEHFYLKH